MFFNACGDRKNIGIENNIFSGKPDLFGEESIGFSTDFFTPLQRIRLTLGIKGHDNYGRSVTPTQPCLAQELSFTLFH